MATYTLRQGTWSFTGDNNYETVKVEGRELGTVTFAINGDDIRYCVFETDSGKIVIYFIERSGYDVIGEVYEYSNLAEAKEHYAFILRKAGVI